MNQLSTRLDQWSISLSALCLAHCLLVPVLALALPVVSTLPLGEEGFHQMLVWAVLPISLLALTLGCRKHKHWSIFTLGLSGLLLLLLSAIFGHDLGEWVEKAGTVIASVLIAVSHWKNYRLCQKRACPCSASE